MLSCFASSEVVSISKKGSKYAVLNRIKVKQNEDITTSGSLPIVTTTPSTTTTEDPFFSDADDNDLFADFDDAFEGIFKSLCHHTIS